eukprot:412336_1
MSAFIYFFAVSFLNIAQCLTWYRGNYIKGDYSNSETFGAFYSNAINKIILVQYASYRSSQVSLFDPYSCTFEPINTTYTDNGKLNSFTSRDVTNIDDTIYIDGKSDSHSDNILSFDPLTFLVSDINFKTTENSCLIADETNNKLYSIGGGSNERYEECTYDEHVCTYGESYTKVYSIDNQISFYDNPMNEKRRNPACLAYQNNLYVLGGNTKQLNYKSGYGNDGPYFNEILSVEKWNLNVTNTQSLDYGWKYVQNMNLSSAYPSTIIFNNKIYLFNFFVDAKDNYSTIQIFDPLQHSITNDASSESFYIKTKDLWNIQPNNYDDPDSTNDPINVNDELIYIFGSQPGHVTKNINTFSFGILNDSVLDRLSPSCFWIPTKSPTMTPSVSPTTAAPNTPSPTVHTYKGGLNDISEQLIIIIIVVILIVILGIISCYVVSRCRKQKRIEGIASSAELVQYNECGLGIKGEGEGEGQISNNIDGQIEGK